MYCYYYPDTAWVPGRQLSEVKLVAGGALARLSC